MCRGFQSQPKGLHVFLAGIVEALIYATFLAGNETGMWAGTKLDVTAT